MILGAYIIGLIAGVIGIIKKVKGSCITCLMWLLAITSWIFLQLNMMASIAFFIISIILFLVTMCWIIRINKAISEVK